MARLLSAPYQANSRPTSCRSSRNRLPSRRCEQPPHELHQRSLVGLVRVDPAGHRLRFPRRLQHRLLDALAEGRQRRIVQVAHRQAADECLVQQVFVVARRRGRALDRALAAAVQTAPAPHGQAPRRRHFADHVDARAHVLGALGVVRRGGQHRVRPVLRAVAAGGVEGRHGGAESVRIAADVVQRDQPMVPIQRGVLDALGGHRRGELLQPSRERAVVVGQRRRRAGQRLAEQHAADEVEHAAVGATAAPARAAHRPFDEAAVLRARPRRRCRCGRPGTTPPLRPAPRRSALSV